MDMRKYGNLNNVVLSDLIARNGESNTIYQVADR
jgi:hypothetical protein